MSISAPAPVIRNAGPPVLVRGIYFVLVGWWLSFIWIVLAYIASLTILGIPLGFMMLNRIPQVATLRPQKVVLSVNEDGSYSVHRPQHPWWLRTIWYLLVGWWATGIWLTVAWLLGVTIIGIPLSFVMYDAVGKVLTLRK